jgi:hypothetical protein
VASEESIAVINRSKNLVNDITGIPEIPFMVVLGLLKITILKILQKGNFFTTMEISKVDLRQLKKQS